MGNKLKIHVIYCGGWGYRPKFESLKKELERIFPDQLDITGEGTPSTTGYLEVQIVGGPLIHSKKNGMGYVDSSEKLEKIVKGVQKALEEMETSSG